MIRVVVIVEGPTEESFVKGPLAEALWPKRIFLTPIVLGVPGHRGGRVNYARLQKDLIRQLKQDPGVYCSTMIDFYGLGKGFPGTTAPRVWINSDRVLHLEREIKADICVHVPELRPDLRLIPYISIHEFEALLFSDPVALARTLHLPHKASRLQKVREEFPTPEDINDDPATAPSKRVLSVCSTYRKVIDGTLAARAVGVERMRHECKHFRMWLEQLETLPAR